MTSGNSLPSCAATVRRACCIAVRPASAEKSVNGSLWNSGSAIAHLRGKFASIIGPATDGEWRKNKRGDQVIDRRAARNCFLAEITSSSSSSSFSWPLLPPPFVLVDIHIRVRHHGSATETRVLLPRSDVLSCSV